MNPLAGLSEAEFQRQIVHLATDWGWKVCHVNRSRTGRGWTTSTSSPGFPDLTMLRPPQLVFLELKKTGGQATSEQIEWIRGLQACTGVEAYIVGPADAGDVWRLLAQRPAAR